MLTKLYERITKSFRRFVDNHLRGPNDSVKVMRKYPEREAIIQGTTRPEAPKLPEKFEPVNIIDILNENPDRQWNERSISDVDKIIVHQAMSGGSTFGVNKYHIGPNHISSRGCPKICYTYSIEDDGTVYMCNNLTDVTWHCKGQNTSGIGILVLGDFDGPNYRGTEEPTEEQRKSLARLLDYITDKLDLDKVDVHGHHDFGKLACPGDALYSEVLNYKRGNLWKMKNSKKKKRE